MNFRALARRLAAHGWEPLNTKLAPVEETTARASVKLEQLGMFAISGAES